MPVSGLAVCNLRMSGLRGSVGSMTHWDDDFLGEFGLSCLARSLLAYVEFVQYVPMLSNGVTYVI